ncbi:hypothetical protein Barb4_00462 [Bacteroidales bacterium Barb4]|nr:hypothetical protein Barb4_00462 [Bacteroidales bacterium Barb4]
MRVRLLGFGLVSLWLLGACSGSPLGKRATGMIYEVVVVMEQSDWDSEAGEAVKKDLQSDVPGLPQSEATMKVIYSPPAKFDGMLTYVRNIFLLNINPGRFTKVSLHAEKDRRANGQTVVVMNAPDKETVQDYMKEHVNILANYYSAVERARLTTLLDTDYSKALTDKVTDKFGIALKVPSAMNTSKEDGKDFFWASNNAPTGRTDLIVYTFPYRDAETFTREYLIAKRDSVMKLNMPGSFPGSYMITETAYIQPAYKAITVNGKYCGELRGLWRMEGDMMGGPFVSHARLDESNNRVVVVEGFVYSPETDKKNYIRRIEAALYTLHLPGENTELPEIEIVSNY